MKLPAQQIDQLQLNLESKKVKGNYFKYTSKNLDVRI